MDKIKRTGIINLFNEVIITFDTKTNAIEKICKNFPNEKIYFIDDKQKHFDELRLENCPNLTPILYTGQNLKLID